MRTEATHQTLSHHRFHGAGDQERLDSHIGQPGIRARGVVRVQRAEHQVTGQRRLNGVLGRLQVADFADQHHVRVMTQNGPQRTGERQPDLGMDLNLIDAGQLVFDRVFRGDDLRVRTVDFDQRTVERRGLTGPGRAGHQNDAVRQPNQLAKHAIRFRVHPQTAQFEDHRAFVENTQHDPFAVDHRDHRDTDVDFAPFTRNLMRPSCGRRRSAMFKCDMIFKRLMMAAWNRLISGGIGCGCKMPSTR